jgi:hypothetical protein
LQGIPEDKLHRVAHTAAITRIVIKLLKHGGRPPEVVTCNYLHSQSESLVLQAKAFSENEQGALSISCLR